jgi:hypothetical protein
MQRVKILKSRIISIFRGERKTDHLVEAVLH